MKVITRKEDNVISAISNTAEDTGEPTRNIILDNSAIAYAPNEKPNIYDVEEIPEGVEVEKYCYTEADGFTLNPNYQPPEPSTDERLDVLETDSVQDETDINALEDAVLDILEQLADLQGGSV